MEDVQEKISLTFDEANPKRISYILATKNRAKFLNDALQRISGMLEPNDELIIVDGESSDNTKEVVERFKDTVNIFISEPDSESYEASNKGIMLSSGKYIYFTADDDVVHKDGIEKAIEVLEKNPEIDILLCGGIKQFDSGSTFPFYIPPGANYGRRPEDTVIYGATGSGLIVRRHIFAKIGLPEGVAADGEIVTKCIAKGGVVKFCRIKLFHQTIYNHSVTKSKKYLHRKHQFEYVKQYCSRPFYWKYRITRMFKDNFLNISLNRLRRFIKVKIIGSSEKKHNKDGEYIWDGGFS